MRKETAPFVVQCPSNGDADFASRRLAAAGEADRMLTHYHTAKPDFETAISRLDVINAVEFSWAAMEFVSLWLNNAPCIRSGSCQYAWSEAFAYMAGAGFFTLSGQQYRMTHPHMLSSKAIESALLQLAETEDEDHYLHPEWLLTTTTRENAFRRVQMIKRSMRALPALSVSH